MDFIINNFSLKFRTLAHRETDTARRWPLNKKNKGKESARQAKAKAGPKKGRTKLSVIQINASQAEEIKKKESGM